MSEPIEKNPFPARRLLAMFVAGCAFGSLIPFAVGAFGLIGARAPDPVLPPLAATLPDDIDTRIAAIVRREIEANPEAIVASVNRFVASQQEAAAQAADGQAVQKAAEMASVEGLPIVGNPEGTVTVAYFFDANCGYCKRLDPVIKKLVADNADLRVIHREIPVLGPQSENAAHVANVVWQLHPELYGAFHDALLALQGSASEDAVRQIALATLGEANAEAVLAAASDPTDSTSVASSAVVADNLRLATEAGITGTPFVYVLDVDGVLRGAGDDAGERLQAMIDEARAARG